MHGGNVEYSYFLAICENIFAKRLHVKLYRCGGAFYIIEGIKV